MKNQLERGGFTNFKPTFFFVCGIQKISPFRVFMNETKLLCVDEEGWRVSKSNFLSPRCLTKLLMKRLETPIFQVFFSFFFAEPHFQLRRAGHVDAGEIPIIFPMVSYLEDHPMTCSST